MEFHVLHVVGFLLVAVCADGEAVHDVLQRCDALVGMLFFEVQEQLLARDLSDEYSVDLPFGLLDPLGDIDKLRSSVGTFTDQRAVRQDVAHVVFVLVVDHCGLDSCIEHLRIAWAGMCVPPTLALAS